MKKTKLTALLLACVLLVTGLTGCTGQGQDVSDDEQTQTETVMEAEQGEQEAEAQTAHEGEWTFTDSLGRTVTLEGELTRVAPSGNMAQQCLFSVAPEKMVGLGSDLGETAAKYYGETAELPVFGAFYGSKANLNKEALLAADPQIVIDIGEVKDDMAEELDQLQEQIELLKSSDAKTYEIAEMTGFSEPNYFSFIFKKNIGVSPSQYRASHR